MPREKVKKRASYYPNIFSHVIYNKAECLKNLNIYSYISIAYLRAITLKFLTAILMTKKNNIPEAREFRFFAN